MSAPQPHEPVLPPPRRPVFLRFILTGAVLGFAVLGGIAAGGWLEHPSTTVGAQVTYSASTGVGWVGLLGASLGALLGALLAVLLDRSGRAPGR